MISRILALLVAVVAPVLSLLFSLGVAVVAAVAALSAGGRVRVLGRARRLCAVCALGFWQKR